MRTVSNTGLPPARIAIVTTLSYWGASPTLMNMIGLLSNAGCLVDVIGRSSRLWPTPQFESERVSFRLSPWTTRVALPGSAFLREFLLVAKSLIFNRPDVVIAVDTEGLALSGPTAVLFGIPLIHCALEVRFARNWQTWLQKRLEKSLYRFVEFTIIQDKVRANALLESNGLKTLDFVYLPNTSGLQPPARTKSDYLRRRWNIPAKQKIILSAGNQSDMTLAHELARAAKKWPADWTLIIHGWGEEEGYLATLRAICDGRHEIFSEELVDYQELDLLTSSADIGIALYWPRDQNVYEMATSSGKIWQYLRCGLPVVTVDFPSLRDMVSQGQFGLCVHGPEEVQRAIEQLFSDYPNYSSRAQVYFDRHGDFAKNFQPVLSRLAACVRTNVDFVQGIGT